MLTRTLVEHLATAFLVGLFVYYGTGDKDVAVVVSMVQMVAGLTMRIVLGPCVTCAGPPRKDLLK